MVIRVFVSKVSGNKEVKRKQEWIVSVLTARKIPFEEIDISDPTREADKQFMRENSPLKEGQTVPMAPQIFNADEYCGDYDSFQEAIECAALNDLLKLGGGGGSAGEGQGAATGAEPSSDGQAATAEAVQ